MAGWYRKNILSKMNRKTFLTSLAALAALPSLAKTEAAPFVAEPVCTADQGKIVGVLFTDQNTGSIIQKCEEIRKEMEAIAGRNYAFHLKRNKGAIDIIS